MKANDYVYLRMQISDQKMENASLERKLKDRDQQLNRIGEENRRLAKENKMLDDASDYWKTEFGAMFNAIVELIRLDPDNFSDGEVVDAIHDTLKKYEGQSDEQYDLND